MEKEQKEAGRAVFGKTRHQRINGNDQNARGELQTCLQDGVPNLSNRVGEIGSEVHSSAR